ncbi:MAG: trypsin-like peptidase domain-containing protein [Gammaproteobacteria bacterium]|nr:trypsin-like peptidase domain-containing protein [Gammaproteobacteria bacterium]
MELFNQDTMNAPWGLISRFKLVQLALNFFNVENLSNSRDAIGKAPPRKGGASTLTGNDFIQYIVANGTFQRRPNAIRVAQILEQMVSGGLLVRAGYGNPSLGGLGDHYFYVSMKWDLSRGEFKLARTLGPEFLYQLCAPGLVHITGTNRNGDVVAGTGIVVHPSSVLTCRHVVSDMKLDPSQEFQSKTLQVNEDSIYRHPDIDLAILKVNRPLLNPLVGMKYQRPVMAQTVFTLGYPKLPGLKEAPVIMQQGAVTSDAVTALSGQSLFLFSAISRPGNSGGPVMSEDGYMVGLCSVDSKGEYHSAEAFSPHYAGIPGQVVVDAVSSFGLGIKLPFEEHT